MAVHHGRDLRERGRGKKLIRRWEWECDSRRRDYCAACRKLKPAAACAGCEYAPPPLGEENLEAWTLWRAVSTQWRTSLSGAIGLDYNAVLRVAEVLGIEMGQGLLGKLQALEAATLKRPRRDAASTGQGEA